MPVQTSDWHERHVTVPLATNAAEQLGLKDGSVNVVATDEEGRRSEAKPITIEVVAANAAAAPGGDGQPQPTPAA